MKNRSMYIYGGIFAVLAVAPVFLNPDAARPSASGEKLPRQPVCAAGLVTGPEAAGVFFEGEFQGHESILLLKIAKCSSAVSRITV